MKVKDIVFAAAQTLGLYEGVAAYFNEGKTELEREAELLLACLNRVECALALEYLPLYAEDELLAVTNRVEFASLKYSPVRILGVEDGAGNPVKYKLYPKYLKAQAGICKVTYSYTPDEKSMEDESDFAALATNSLLIYGVLAEYCAVEGRFEESAVWEKTGDMFPISQHLLLTLENLNGQRNLCQISTESVP